MAVVSFVGDAVITVSESVGTVVLCTELSGTNLDIDLTIPYETIDGTAESTYIYIIYLYNLNISGSKYFNCVN